MKFGFDIDDTLINLREHAFHIYNKKLGKNIPVDIFHKLDRVEIHEPFGLTDEEGSTMWTSSLEEIYYTSCPPFPNALETLRELDEEGHDIFYITSRNKAHGERTKEWLKRRGFPVKDDHFFYGMRDDEKVEIIQQLQLDYYFDDKPDVLNTLVDKGNTVVFVKDQSYNRHLDFPRITDWGDLQRVISNQ
ncbi:HAD hydrolase-like protein [Aquibacillus koreensis]|uniref:Nucleotidase n=1 Tax=Aquibacillus koreensis TaxID=279446 RepID=A0A9X3WIG1_9BACI|nr:HAD family acid phosphatase [Aquibacillus koreensis]MCT2534841.1 HAD hydrolase-like protein [Aquibacillus koreensis]MDC3419548.1 HAD hydrolase-like protein [Aquibacillus koreensis]